MGSVVSPLHRVWRLLPARQRRSLLWRSAALLAPRPDAVAPVARSGVAVAGELGVASGLGEGARLMLRALDSLAVARWAVDVGSMLQRAVDPVPDLPDGVPLVLHVNSPQLPAMLRRLPRGYLKGRRIIGYWAWELPEIAPDWRVGCDFVHEAWAPSRFTASALEKVLPGRVRVVPHAVAVAPPVPSALDRAAFGLGRDAVVTLVSFSLASSFVRKNPLAAIAAHRLAFDERPDRVLVLKVSGADHDAGGLAQLHDAVGGATNIRVETREFSAADAHALTACADMVLSLHHSEGFGLVLAEAMMLGRPVVATGWSGNMDFMDENSAALVGFTLAAPDDPRGVYQAKGALWADPDIGEAAAHLRRLADDPGERGALGARGRAMALQRLDAAPLAAALEAIGL